MIDYGAAYQRATHRALPAQHAALERLFVRIAAGESLPPRSVQAVEAGLVAHALSEEKEDPAHYRYYDWVVKHCLKATPPKELSAQLIGMAFVSANVLATDLPQPLTLNPWQAPGLADWPLATRRAVVIENNGVFIWLHHLHPDWPLINQGGNDFQPVYLDLLRRFTARGMALTYLGDLDARGIRIANTLRQALPAQPEFLALQTPGRVLTWVSTVGKSAARRTAAQRVTDPALQQEADSITQFGFVEQEQLLDDYAALIPAWLAQSGD